MRLPSFAAVLRSPTLLGLPAIAFVVIFAVWPMADFLSGSLASNGAASLVQYQHLMQSATFALVMGRTLSVAVLVTVVCVVLAYPMAYALTKARRATKSVLIGLVAIPYLTSVIVRTYAWAAILSLQGPVNSALLALGLIGKPMLLGHSDFGTGIGMIHILLPIATLTLWSALEKIDPMQRTVSASLGASKIRGFSTVYLPQSIPGVASSAVLIYILSLGAYVIPATLGGTRGLLFAQLVVEEATSLLDWNLAGAMAAVMLVAAAVPAIVFAGLAWIWRRTRGKRPVGPFQGLADRYVFPALDVVPDRLWTLAWQALALLTLIFLLLPELVVIAFSFGPERQITFPPAYLTLAGYAHTLTDPTWMQPLQRSLEYASFDAVIAVGLGALAAYGFARGQASWARLGTALLVVPVVLPEIVIAISYFIFANRWGLSGTAPGIVLGQAVGTVGLVVVILSGIVRQVDVGLEHAAAMCGASRWQVLAQIVLPLIAPGLVVALVYAFLTAFDNLVLPLFIVGTNDTIPVRMFLSLQEQLTSSPAVIASILITALAVGLTAVLSFPRRLGLPLPGAVRRQE